MPAVDEQPHDKGEPAAVPGPYRFEYAGCWFQRDAFVSHLGVCGRQPLRKIWPVLSKRLFPTAHGGIGDVASCQVLGPVKDALDRLGVVMFIWLDDARDFRVGCLAFFAVEAAKKKAPGFAG